MLPTDSGMPVHFFILQSMGFFFNQCRQQPVIQLQRLQLLDSISYISHLHNLAPYKLYPTSATAHLFRYTDSYPVNARLWRS